MERQRVRKTAIVRRQDQKKKPGSFFDRGSRKPAKADPDYYAGEMTAG